jgi:hypothetical protein
MEGWRQERLGSKAGTHREEEKNKNILTGKKKRKTYLTLTGLLMEDLGPRFPAARAFDVEAQGFANSYGLSDVDPTTRLCPVLLFSSNAVKNPSFCSRKSLVSALNPGGAEVTNFWYPAHVAA